MYRYNEESIKVSDRDVTYKSTDIKEAESAIQSQQVDADPQANIEELGQTETETVSDNLFGSTRDIKITPLSSGFLVKVGCQSIAVETNEKLVDMLAKYLADPFGFERKWYSKDVRNRLENI